MPLFNVPLEANYYRESDCDDLYQNEGSIDVEAANAEAAIAVVEEMLNRFGNCLQTKDPRIEWEFDWSEEHDDMVYEDWSFGIPADATATEIEEVG